MRFRRLALRLSAALVAVVQAFTPGTASIVDARPAATALVERATTHVDAPNSPHTIAHQEQCALCGLAAQSAVPSERPLLPEPRTAPRPPHAVRFAAHGTPGRGSTQPRAPPA